MAVSFRSIPLDKEKTTTTNYTAISILLHVCMLNLCITYCVLQITRILQTKHSKSKSNNGGMSMVLGMLLFCLSSYLLYVLLLQKKTLTHTSYYPCTNFFICITNNKRLKFFILRVIYSPVQHTSLISKF